MLDESFNEFTKQHVYFILIFNIHKFCPVREPLAWEKVHEHEHNTNINNDSNNAAVIEIGVVAVVQ